MLQTIGGGPYSCCCSATSQKKIFCSEFKRGVKRDLKLTILKSNKCINKWLCGCFMTEEMTYVTDGGKKRNPPKKSGCTFDLRKSSTRVLSVTDFLSGDGWQIQMSGSIWFWIRWSWLKRVRRPRRLFISSHQQPTLKKNSYAGRF